MSVRAATTLVQLGIWAVPLYLTGGAVVRRWNEATRRRAARRHRLARPVTPAAQSNAAPRVLEDAGQHRDSHQGTGTSHTDRQHVVIVPQRRPLTDR